MILFSYDEWVEVNEERITKISLKKFTELYEKYAHNNNQILYKRIHNPDFTIGLFKKDADYSTSLQPIKEKSLTCLQNDKHIPNTELFIVVPFKGALFSILHREELKKGYWKDRIEWLNTLQEKELWTESSCLLIHEKVWNEFIIKDIN